MAEAGVYYVSVVPDMSKFNSALDKGAGRAKGVFGRIMSTGVGMAFGNALTKGVDMFVASLDTGISRLDTISNFPKVLANVGIDAEASARAISKLSDGIDGLPTTLDAAASATQRFALQNGDVEESADLFLALNNAILAGGQSAEMQASALEQVSQAYAKGKPDMAEWRTMTMTMGPALQMVAQSWGMSVDEMGEALRNGDKSMDEFLGTIQTLNTEGIGNFKSLEEQATVSTGSIGTAISNVGNRMSKAWATILGAIGQERIAGAINAVSNSFTLLADAVAPVIGTIADGIVDFISKADFSPLISALNFVIQLIQPWIEGVQRAIEQGPMVQQMLGAIGRGVEVFIASWSALGAAFDNLIVQLQPVIDLLGPAIQVACDLAVGNFLALGACILGIGSGFLNFATLVVNLVATFAANIPKIPGYFSSMVSSVKAYFSNLIANIQGIPGRIVGFFTGIGARITAAIGSIHFPTPHVSWETLSVAGMKTPVRLPHVSWYATGGIVNGAQLIGAGEKGAELMWPSYEPYMGKYAQAIAEHMPAGVGADVTNIYIGDMRVNDDEAIRRDVLQLVADMRRLGAMNRG